MERIRTAGAMLAILSAIIAVLFARLDTGMVPLFLVVSAACIAIVAPFRAAEPRQRRRVVIAFLTYTLGLIAGVVWAFFNRASTDQLVILALHAFAGAVLTAWAFKTRNRWRRPSGLRAYYQEQR